MVSRFFSCDPNRLRLLLDDKLPENSQADLARHVQTCRRCRRRLETLAAEACWWRDAAELLRPSEEDGSSEPGPRLDFLTPSDDPHKLGRLGPYQIEEVIGHGGMGIVLKGYEPLLGRHVAVKVLAPHLATSGAARQRFAREARAAAAVVHEHVVAIHAVDSADGVPYLVMPFVPGVSLDRRIKDTGPMDVAEILRIGMQISKGLAAAHAQGLVHRDVKPANILLENDVDRVMLTDFGLARAVDDASLTQSGVVAGTPQFMSPEQAKGEAVDHRADLFSLGSVMYAMCTGRPPFRAETTLAILRRICESSPRPIRDVNPGIPEWLVEIVDKLHEKDPADRFQTASEVADILGRHLAHLQHPRTAPMPPRLAGKRRVRKRIGALITRRRVVLPALLLIGLIGLWTITETAGITHVVHFVTGTSTNRSPDAPLSPIASSPAEAPPVDSLPSIEDPSHVPDEVAGWDDGVEDDLEESRHRIHDLENASLSRGDHVEVPDEPAAVKQKLNELEQEIIHAWP
jgi:eukaryotic-like serine/threonine-protein kinase